MTAIDMFYGDRGMIRFSAHMAHHCGFTAKLLADAMQAAGFENAQAHRAGNWNVLGVGVKG